MRTYSILKTSEDYEYCTIGILDELVGSVFRRQGVKIMIAPHFLRLAKFIN